MKFISLFVLPMVLLAQQTYFGNNPRGCCQGQAGMNPEVNWDKNHIKNGDFEFQTIPKDKKWLSFNSMDDWSSTCIFEIGLCSIFEPTMQSQCLQLDSDTGDNSYWQSLNLTEGKYELKFDMAAIYNHHPSQSSFYVYFNGIEILKVRPNQHGVTTITKTVSGRNGINTLEFLDNGKIDKFGAVIDNVGIHPWKINDICVSEIEAVGAGYPVTAISVLDQNHNNYQLDSGEPGQAFAWCPIKYQTHNQWIQVSSLVPKLWNSVILQGRGDANHQMTKFKIQYTLDGNQWMEYENGKCLKGPPERNGKIRYNLKPFYAITVRIVTLEWTKAVCLRFGATFINN